MIDDMSESNVTVPKAQLLEALRKNREGHRSAFLEAQEGYREACVAQLDRLLADARNGRPFAVRELVMMVAPEEHTKDYDRVIRMLEMSTATDIKIDEARFAQLVLDDWGWQEKFRGTNALYSKAKR